MYALPRGPSKIVASTRRTGQTRLDVDEKQNEPTASEMNSGPKPYFAHNGKPRNMRQNPPPAKEEMTQAHKDAAKFLSDSWDKTMEKYEKEKSNPNSKSTIEWYRSK